MEGIFKATTTIPGPNDAVHIVWAIGEYFLLIICVSFLFLTSIYSVSNRLQRWDPNDGVTVVWVLGLEICVSSPSYVFFMPCHHLYSTQRPCHHPPPLCHIDCAHNNCATHNCYVGEFFFYSCFFLLLNVLYRYYLCSSCMEGLVQGNDDDIGPKWCDTSFGPLVSNFFFFNSCYFQLLTRTIYRLMNGLKQWDPSASQAPVFPIYTHGHNNTATSPHQATSTNQHQHQHQQPAWKGPNNAIHVVWALYEFFFKNICFFSIC